MELHRVMAKKRKEASIQTSFKRTEILREFKEFMKEGGEPNLDALAQRFNLDLDSIREKVEGKTEGTSREDEPEEKAEPKKVEKPAQKPEQASEPAEMLPDAVAQIAAAAAEGLS